MDLKSEMIPFNGDKAENRLPSEGEVSSFRTRFLPSERRDVWNDLNDAEIVMGRKSPEWGARNFIHHRIPKE